MIPSWADAQSLAPPVATVLPTGLAHALFLALEIMLFIYFCFTVVAIFRGAAPIPTRGANVRRMVDLAKVQPGDFLVDLGSGDGRILRAAAAQGARCMGFEINPLLCWYSRLRSFVSRKGDVTVLRKDFWTTDLSNADIVTAYLVPKFMERLKNKVLSEMRTGARVVVAVYPFPDWIPDRQDGKIYLYVIK